MTSKLQLDYRKVQLLKGNLIRLKTLLSTQNPGTIRPDLDQEEDTTIITETNLMKDDQTHEEDEEETTVSTAQKGDQTRTIEVKTKVVNRNVMTEDAEVEAEIVAEKDTKAEKGATMVIITKRGTTTEPMKALTNATKRILNKVRRFF